MTTRLDLKLRSAIKETGEMLKRSEKISDKIDANMRDYLHLNGLMKQSIHLFKELTESVKAQNEVLEKNKELLMNKELI